MLIHGPRKKFWVPQSPALWYKASGGGAPAGTIFTPSTALGSDDVNTGTTFRVVCKLSAASDGKLKVTFTANSTTGLTTTNCSFGKWDGVANASGCTTVPIEATFSGVHGFSLAAGASITSDLIDHSASFSLASTDSVVAIHDDSTPGGQRFSASNTNVDTYFDTGSVSWNLQTTPGYAKLAGIDYSVAKIETA